MVRKLFFAAVFIVVLLVLFRVVALTKVPCGFVGIRRPQLAGSGAGRVKPKLLMPGMRFAVPIVHQVGLVSTRVRKMDVEHVEISLRDNLRVYVDATTTFRVEPTPLALNYALNDGEQYVQRVMLNDIKSVMRRFLQETNADGFLKVSWRTKQKTAIEKQLSELLAKRGVSLVQFFMRDFAFAASYEQELKRQRLVRQHRHKRALQIRLAALQVEGNAQSRVARAKIAEVKNDAKRRVDAAEHEAKLVAEEADSRGRFMVEQARLEGKRRMSEVLASTNPNRMMKMELIEALQSGLKFAVFGYSDLGLLDALGGHKPRGQSAERGR